MEDYPNYLDPLSRSLWCTPFLRAQILLQTQDLIPTFKNSAPLKGFLDTFNRICTFESKVNLWKGGMALSFVQIGNLLFRHLFIGQIKGVNDVQKERWPKYLMISPDPIVAAAIMAWNAIFHPLEVIRVRMSCHGFGVKETGYPVLSAICKDMFKTEGFRAFYRGYVPMTAYMIIHEDVFQPAIKSFYDDLTPSDLALRVLRDVTLYLLIVLGHRMMIDASVSGNRFKTIQEQCKHTFQRFGVRGFYKGFQLNICIQLKNAYDLYSYKNVTP